MTLLGDRTGSVHKFINFDAYDGCMLYTAESDMSYTIDYCPIPLLHTINGYMPFMQHALTTMVYGINDDGALIRQTIQHQCNYVISPYTLKPLICSRYELSGTGSDIKINICEPIKMSISLMGINSIKDLDMHIGDAKKTTYTSSYTVTFQ